MVYSRTVESSMDILVGIDFGGTSVKLGLVERSGRVFRGARGYAAEIGHMCMDPNGPWCVCGSRGCFEQYSSGTAIRDAYWLSS